MEWIRSVSVEEPIPVNDISYLGSCCWWLGRWPIVSCLGKVLIFSQDLIASVKGRDSILAISVDHSNPYLI